MGHNLPVEVRTLVLAPRGQDAETISKVLSRSQIDCTICDDMPALITALKEGAGTALVTEEALHGGNIASLTTWLSGQPAWSDFSIILLISNQSKRNNVPFALLEDLSNVILLERPLNAETLRRATSSALRARKRQYQTRSVLQERTQAEERLRLALNAGRLGAWEVNLRTGESSASDTCKANFGRSPDAVLSRAELLTSIHPDDRQRTYDTVKAAVDGMSDFDVEFRVSWPDGSTRWVQVRGQTTADKFGTTIGLAGVSLDVTDQLESAQKLRESQNALRHLNDTLEQRILHRTGELAQLNDRLMREINERERTQVALVQAQKMEAIGRLTGGIAHDFNNLLHVVVGNVDLIDRISSDERVKRFALTAKKATQRGTKLTGQLLAFARNQSLDLKAVDLPALIDGMTDLLRVSVGSGVKVEFDFPDKMPAALADLNQMEMAILNLAINARDAMPEGGKLVVRCTVHDMVGETLPSGHYAVVSVTDTGCGIRPDILAKVFDPFFTTKPIGQGTGLGLSQVYGIAKQSGGTARIMSEPGRGTTVEIWLPLAGDRGNTENDAELAANESQHGMKILVVEDDDEVRHFMVESLEILGYQVFEAVDGLDGIKQIAITHPDLLIVDFLMPGMNGAEVVKKVSADTPELPIIIATGYADMRAIDEVIGKNAILRKPFQINDLAASVRVALNRIQA
ncbi:MAG: response regulator [Herminiimonas sp.]|nr:response regulator [Herminiimonas sp.]